MDPKAAKDQVINKIQANIVRAKNDFKETVDRTKALEERKVNLARKLVSLINNTEQK